MRVCHEAWRTRGDGHRFSFLVRGERLPVSLQRTAAMTRYWIRKQAVGEGHGQHSTRALIVHLSIPGTKAKSVILGHGLYNTDNSVRLKMRAAVALPSSVNPPHKTGTAT